MKYFILNTLLLSVFLLNNNTPALILILSLFVIILINYGTSFFSYPKFLILISIIIAFALNFYNINLKSGIRIIELFIGFSLFPIKFNANHISIQVLKIIVLYLFLFFIGNLLGIGFFQNFILNYYPAEGNSWEILYDGTISYSDNVNDILSQRLGSIYYNPNLLGQNLTILVIIYLIAKSNNKYTLWDYLILLLAFIMIIGSGSRTAFVVTIIIMFFYFKNYMNQRLFYYITIPIFITILFIIGVNTRLLEIFNQTDKATDSMGVKHEILFGYLNNFNFNLILNYIFGFLTFDIQFDYDIGDILHNFGILGLFSIFFFLFYEFLKTRRNFKYFYSFLLISYGATLIINFKFFILTIILLSFIRNESNRNKFNNNSYLI